MKIVLKGPEHSVGRILALDFGARRIGLAISDELGITAQGLETMERTHIREDLARLSAVAREREVSLIVVGNPLTMRGVEGRQSERVRDFAEKLRARSGIEVRLWDERLTSVEAERLLRETGMSRTKRGRAVDRLAAVILLESYLAAMNSRQAEEEPE
jgi:putative holliday junction resolvase